MIFLFYSELFSDLLSNFDQYVAREYVLDDNAYTRNGTWDLETAIKYPICSNKKTKFKDVNKFLKRHKSDFTVSITGSGVCDRMQYIDPQVYIDMLDDSVKRIYENKNLYQFKGKIITAID